VCSEQDEEWTSGTLVIKSLSYKQQFAVYDAVQEIADSFGKGTRTSGIEEYERISKRYCKEGCLGCSGSHSDFLECMTDDAADRANERYYDSFTV
jgi:hypothetical protein